MREEEAQLFEKEEKIHRERMAALDRIAECLAALDVKSK